MGLTLQVYNCIQGYTYILVKVVIIIGEKVRFTTTSDKELLDQLKIDAIKKGRNVNSILEDLIRVYLSPDVKMVVENKQ